jgi:hypothetical protein
LRAISVRQKQKIPRIHDTLMAILQAGGYQCDEQLVEKKPIVWRNLLLFWTHLTKNRYFVGNRVSMTDLYGVAILIFFLFKAAVWLTMKTPAPCHHRLVRQDYQP